MPRMPSGVGVMCSFWLDRSVMQVRPRRLTMWRQTQKKAVRCAWADKSMESF